MSQRWQRKRAKASHVDDWLITYADMITLLLCFFAIFLSVSLPKKMASQQLVMPQHIETPVALATSNDPKVPDNAPPPLPALFQSTLPFHAVTDADQPADEKPAPDASQKVEMNSVAPETVVSYLAAPLPAALTAPLDPKLTEGHDAAVQMLGADLAAEQEPSPVLTSPQLVDRLKNTGNANFEAKGDRITTLQISSAAFFGSASAALSPSGKAILQDVAVNLKSDKLKDYEVTVEGHTDDQPINTLQFPSNWELSTARASAVVHFLLEQGVPAKKLRAAGYADTFPLAPNRNAAGDPIPENEAKNRRVVIKLEKIERAPSEKVEANEAPAAEARSAMPPADTQETSKVP